MMMGCLGRTGCSVVLEAVGKCLCHLGKYLGIALCKVVLLSPVLFQIVQAQLALLPEIEQMVVALHICRPCAISFVCVLGLAPAVGIVPYDGSFAYDAVVFEQVYETLAVNCLYCCIVGNACKFQDAGEEILDHHVIGVLGSLGIVTGP